MSSGIADIFMSSTVANADLYSRQKMGKKSEKEEESQGRGDANQKSENPGDENSNCGEKFTPEEQEEEEVSSPSRDESSSLVSAPAQVQNLHSETTLNAPALLPKIGSHPNNDIWAQERTPVVAIRAWPSPPSSSFSRLPSPRLSSSSLPSPQPSSAAVPSPPVATSAASLTIARSPQHRTAGQHEGGHDASFPTSFPTLLAASPKQRHGSAFAGAFSDLFLYAQEAGPSDEADYSRNVGNEEPNGGDIGREIRTLINTSKVDIDATSVDTINKLARDENVNNIDEGPPENCVAGWPPPDESSVCTPKVETPVMLPPIASPLTTPAASSTKLIVLPESLPDNGGASSPASSQQSPPQGALTGESDEACRTPPTTDSRASRVLFIPKRNTGGDRAGVFRKSANKRKGGGPRSPAQGAGETGSALEDAGMATPTSQPQKRDFLVFHGDELFLSPGALTGQEARRNVRKFLGDSGGGDSDSSTESKFQLSESENLGIVNSLEVTGEKARRFPSGARFLDVFHSGNRHILDEILGYLGPAFYRLLCCVCKDLNCLLTQGVDFYTTEENPSALKKSFDVFPLNIPVPSIPERFIDSFVQRGLLVAYDSETMVVELETKMLEPGLAWLWLDAATYLDEVTGFDEEFHYWRAKSRRMIAGAYGGIVCGGVTVNSAHSSAIQRESLVDSNSALNRNDINNQQDSGLYQAPRGITALNESSRSINTLNQQSSPRYMTSTSSGGHHDPPNSGGCQHEDVVNSGSHRDNVPYYIPDYIPARAASRTRTANGCISSGSESVVHVSAGRLACVEPSFGFLLGSWLEVLALARGMESYGAGGGIATDANGNMTVNVNTGISTTTDDPMVTASLGSAANISDNCHKDSLKELLFGEDWERVLDFGRRMFLPDWSPKIRPTRDVTAISSSREPPDDSSCRAATSCETAQGTNCFLQGNLWETSREAALRAESVESATAKKSGPLRAGFMGEQIGLPRNRSSNFRSGLNGLDRSTSSANHIDASSSLSGASHINGANHNASWWEQNTSNVALERGRHPLDGGGHSVSSGNIHSESAARRNNNNMNNNNLCGSRVVTSSTNNLTYVNRRGMKSRQNNEASLSLHNKGICEAALLGDIGTVYRLRFRGRCNAPKIASHSTSSHLSSDLLLDVNNNMNSSYSSSGSYKKYSTSSSVMSSNRYTNTSTTNTSSASEITNMCGADGDSVCPQTHGGGVALTLPELTQWLCGTRSRKTLLMALRYAVGNRLYFKASAGVVLLLLGDTPENLHRENPQTIQEIGNKNLLHEACHIGNVYIVRIFLEYRVSLRNISDGIAGATPLHHAASNGHANIVALLVKFSAQVNARSRAIDGNTALHSALKTGHVEVVKTLLKLGACPVIKTQTGKTPIDVLTESSRVRAFRYTLCKKMIRPPPRHADIAAASTVAAATTGGGFGGSNNIMGASSSSSVPAGRDLGPTPVGNANPSSGCVGRDGGTSICGSNTNTNSSSSINNAVISSSLRDSSGHRSTGAASAEESSIRTEVEATREARREICYSDTLSPFEGERVEKRIELGRSVSVELAKSGEDPSTVTSPSGGCCSTGEISAESSAKKNVFSPKICGGGDSKPHSRDSSSFSSQPSSWDENYSSSAEEDGGAVGGGGNSRSDMAEIGTQSSPKSVAPPPKSCPNYEAQLPSTGPHSSPHQCTNYFPNPFDGTPFGDYDNLNNINHDIIDDGNVIEVQAARCSQVHKNGDYEAPLNTHFAEGVEEERSTNLAKALTTTTMSLSSQEKSCGGSSSSSGSARQQTRVDELRTTTTSATRWGTISYEVTEEDELRAILQEYTDAHRFCWSCGGGTSSLSPVTHGLHIYHALKNVVSRGTLKGSHAFS